MKLLISVSTSNLSPKQEAYKNVLQGVCDEYGIEHPFDTDDEDVTRAILQKASVLWQEDPMNA